MTEQEMRANMVVIVKLTTDELTDIELAALNTVAQLDQDPKGRCFNYEVVKPLFDNDRMHEETKLALAQIVNDRLSLNA